MSPSPPPKVVVIGAGIGGLALAVALRSRGFCVEVYEKARDLQPIGAALGLFPNGLAALGAVSETVLAKVRKSAIQSTRMIIRHAKTAEVITERNEAEKKDQPGTVQPLLLVWYLLQQFLYEELSPTSVHLAHEFVRYESEKDGGLRVVLRRRDGGEVIVGADCLVGVDGIHSAVRRQMFGEAELRFHSKMMFRAVIETDKIQPPEVVPPRGTQLAFQAESPGKLFAFRETAAGLLTVTAMDRFEVPDVLGPQHEGESSSSIALRRKERLKQLFGDFADPVPQLVDCIPPSALHETGVWDIQVLPHWVSASTDDSSKGPFPVVLMGDAAHAMTPGLGQGANMALEDAITLARCLSVSREPGVGVHRALTFFEGLRRDRVVKVHGASQARTAEVNKTTAANRGERIFPSQDDEWRAFVYGFVVPEEKEILGLLQREGSGTCER